MYKEIEELYKKKSPYNVIKKYLFWIYFIFIFVSLVFNVFNKIIPTIIVMVLMVLCMKKACEKVLNIKLYLGINKVENSESLVVIIKKSEYKMFKDYCKKNKLFNEKSLMCVIEHYRSLIKAKIVSGNLLAIISVIIPIILSFYTKDGFDFNGLATAIPYLISFTIIIVILYFSFRQFIEMKKFLKGEDGMIDRIEEIFSELYIDYINENAVVLKDSSKNKKKKQTRKNTKTSKK